MDKIKIENLDLYYGDFHALKSINLNLPANEITAFIGPSGCGKSTLLKSLNRMNDLIEGCKITGRVTLDDVDLYRGIDVNDLRRRVGMVFQKPNPFPILHMVRVLTGFTRGRSWMKSWSSLFGMRQSGMN